MALEKKKMTKGEKTKQHLYSCAIQLFREKGYDQVSVEEIVREAGTAKGTFYIYFESKADVLLYMLQEYDDYYDKVESELPLDWSVEQRLREVIKCSAAFTEDVMGLDVIRALYLNQLSGSVKGELDTRRALYRVLYRLVEEGQQYGNFLCEESSVDLTNRLVNCVRGMFFEWCLRGGDFSLEEECIKLIELFCRGMRKETNVGGLWRREW